MKKLDIPNVKKSLERIASEMCDGYCKYPEQYVSADGDEDAQTERLVREHCDQCPIAQLFS